MGCPQTFILFTDMFGAEYIEHKIRRKQNSEHTSLIIYILSFYFPNQTFPCPSYVFLPLLVECSSVSLRLSPMKIGPTKYKFNFSRPPYTQHNLSMNERLSKPKSGKHMVLENGRKSSQIICDDIFRLLLFLLFVLWLPGTGGGGRVLVEIFFRVHNIHRF